VPIFHSTTGTHGAGPSPRSIALPAAQQALLESEYDNMQACIRCGLCLTSCPTYLISLAEEEGPRGRIAMARALTEGHLELTPDLLEHENNCLLCEACTRVCPAGVRMEELGVPLRQVFEDLQRRPWWQRAGRRLVYGHLFGSMANFRRLVAVLRLYERTGLRRLARASGLLRLLRLERLDAFLRPIERDFLEPHGQTWEPSGPVVGSAALFAGCVMSTAFAETDRATARLLARAGYRVRATAGQGCCGALNAHGGDREGARDLARRNVEAFESDPAALVVVNAAGCGAMLKEYGHLLRDDPAYVARAEAFAARVRDATEVLAGRLPPLAGGGDELLVTYQEPCHLAHAQGISREPRQLLKGIGGLELVEMKEASLCCGSAGIYNLLHPEKAGQLLDRKLDHALATGAPTIVTTNPGCLLQLQAGLHGRGSRVRVRHIMDVLDEAYSVEARPGPQVPRSTGPFVEQGT
jgi:glycolate oxidase iron-sulfur subunit